MVDFRKAKMNLAQVSAIEDKKVQGESRFFKEGMYDCVIAEVKSGNPQFAPKDPTWKAINITVTATGDKKSFATIEYPTEHTEYNVDGKNWFFKFNDFRAFGIALGMKDEDDLADFITANFETAGALIGRSIKVKFGYLKGLHAKYVSENVFHLVNEKDVPEADSNGNPKIFPNREACEVYSAQTGKKFQAFVRPIGFSASDTPAPKKEEKKVVAKKKEFEMPF